MPASPLILTALRYEANALSHLGRVEVIGIGASRLGAVNTDHTSLLVIAGLAGALDASLQAGDVVIDERSIDAPGRRCPFHCSKTLIGTPAEKSELFRSTSASIVDMESDAVFALARQHNIPFLSIRAISDTARDCIDPAVFRMTAADGNLKPARVAMALIQKPTLLPQLLRLRSNSALALRNLARELDVILKAHAGSASEKNLNQLP
jgi:hypothetical protein